MNNLVQFYYWLKEETLIHEEIVLFLRKSWWKTKKKNKFTLPIKVKGQEIEKRAWRKDRKRGESSVEGAFNHSSVLDRSPGMPEIERSPSRFLLPRTSSIHPRGAITSIFLPFSDTFGVSVFLPLFTHRNSPYPDRRLRRRRRTGTKASEATPELGKDR